MPNTSLALMIFFVAGRNYSCAANRNALHIVPSHLSLYFVKYQHHIKKYLK